jgi:glucose/arabinose dehydrogenase
MTVARAVAICLLVLLLVPVAGARAQSVLDQLNMPKGFEIEVVAKVPGARSLVVMDQWNAVLVGGRGSVVYAAQDTGGDGKYNRVIRAVRGLKSANGIAWREGWLYVAEQHRISRYAAPDLKTLSQAKPEVLYDQLPDNSWHGWRYLQFGPDGKLYVGVGSPCNICRVDGLKGTIVRLNPDGTDVEVFASGVRNSVGLAFHPQTGDLYFSDAGADNMGDDSPPDELNRAEKPGLWFGFPFYGGGHDRTPDFRNLTIMRRAVFPVIEFGAHVTPLGIGFYSGDKFPGDYRYDAFVAQHGSWNRSVPDGYRVMRIRFDKKTRLPVRSEIFIDGWLQANGKPWGRPVDVKQTPGGDLLISDDHAGVIYRLKYTGK